jgi:hypothetical protein
MSDPKLTLSGIEASLDKIEARLNNIDLNIQEINVTLVKNTIDLEEHMRRSDALEAYVRQVDQHVKDDVVKQEIEPIKKHVNQVTWAVRGIFWFVGIIASIAVLLKQFEIF